MENNKRLLITGIGGSIGCHVLDYFLENTDWDIIGIDSFRHRGLTDRVNVILNGELYDPIVMYNRNRVTIHTHDLTAPISKILIDKIGRIDYIINLASLSDVFYSIQNPVPFILNNVQVVLTMLEYTKVIKPQAFIQISTDESKGPSSVYEGHLEWAPSLPSNSYAASKACQEDICISYWRSYGVPLIITHIMNNFGEMQQPSKFPAILQRKITADETVTIHGNENTIGSRYYLHSYNTSSALHYIIENTKPLLHQSGFIDKPDKYNIVGEKRVNNLELAQMIAKLLNKPLKYELLDFHQYNNGHDQHYGLDGTKLAKLGWKPPISLEKSLLQTIIWTKNHPEWNTIQI